MKNLYVNGCSHTYGHKDFLLGPLTCYKHNDLIYEAFKSTTVWSSYIEGNFNKMFNHAMGGTGNSRLVRTTLDFLNNLKEDEVNDWIVILQFSYSNRYEYINDAGIPVKLGFYIDDQGGEIVYEPEFNYDNTLYGIDNNFTITDKDKETAVMLSKFKIALTSSVYERYEYFMNIVTITNILKSRNINYLFSTVDAIDCLNFEKFDNNSIIKSVKQYIDMSKNITSPIHIPGERDPCLHAGTKMNKDYADYIMQQLEHRGML